MVLCPDTRSNDSQNVPCSIFLMTYLTSPICDWCEKGVILSIKMFFAFLTVEIAKSVRNLKMKKLIILLAIIGIIIAAKSRKKRAAYDLPDGVDLIVGQVRTTFFCSRDGYFADVDNGCKIFHVCHTALRDDEPPELQQWSFFCGNQTVFNQLTFTCAYPEEAIPCENSADFFYLNDNIGNRNAPFLTDQDIQRGESLISGRPPPPRVVPGSGRQTRPRPG